jgi:hypothetical protein
MNDRSSFFSFGVKMQLAVVLVLLLGGCTGKVLRTAFRNDSESYADAVNRQLLLNLARMAHDEPPYFVQVGQMNTNYNFGASVGAMPSHARISHPNGVVANLVQDNLTVAGNLGLTGTESPSFQFVPLAGESFARAILAPIDERILMSLFDQGFHADVLMRTMVARIELSDGRTDGKTITLVNHPLDPSYPRFLRLCHYLYEYGQLGHFAVIRPGRPTFTLKSGDVKLADAVSAIQAGYTISDIPGAPKDSSDNRKDKPGKAMDSPVSPNDSSGAIPDNTGSLSIMLPNVNPAIVFDNKALPDPVRPGIEAIFTGANTVAAGDESHGATPEGSAAAKEIKDRLSGWTIKLTMRTFLSVVYAISKEESYFRTLKNRRNEDLPAYGSTSEVDSVRFSRGTFGTNMTVCYKAPIRETETFSPVLTLSKLNETSDLRLQQLVEVDYEGDKFAIADLVPRNAEASTTVGEPGLPSISNRNVFTLLSYLFAQVAIDPQKLPPQQLIQVH